MTVGWCCFHTSTLPASLAAKTKEYGKEQGIRATFDKWYRKTNKRI